MQNKIPVIIGILCIVAGIILNEWLIEELFLEYQLPLTFKLLLWIFDLSLVFSGTIYLFSLKRTPTPIIQWIIQRWDLWLVLPLVTIFFLLTSFIQTNEIHLFEEGVYFSYYALFKVNKLPYIDFYPTFPPLCVYSHIFVEWLFGEILVVQRLFLAFQGVVCVFIAYLLLSQFISDRRIRLLTLITILLFGFEAYFLPRWGGMRFSFYVGYLFLLWSYFSLPERKKTLSWLFGLGFFIGTSNLYAYDTGIHLTALGLVTLFLIPFTENFQFTRRRFHQFLVAVLGFLVPFILWSLFLLSDEKIADYFIYSYYVYLAQTMAVSKIFFVFHQTRFILLSIFLVLLFLGAIYYFLRYGFLKRTLTKQHLIIIVALTGTFFISSSTVRFLNGPQFTMFAVFPMLMWIGVLIDRFSYLLRNLEKRRKRVAFVFLYLGLFLFFWRVTDWELWIKYDALQRNLHMLESSRDNPRANGESGLEAFQYLHEIYTRETPKISSLVRYLHDHTTPDESILAFPYFTELLPALSGRYSATRYPIPLVMIGSPEQQEIYISDIEKEKPRYLVFCPSVRIGTLSMKKLFPEITSYLYQQYHPVDDYPYNEWAVQIWMRNE